MTKNPILDLSLREVVKPEIALILGQLHGVHTVGAFLRAWRNPRKSQELMSAFENPNQARHAAATCATWLGVRTSAIQAVPGNWWTVDADAQPTA